MKLAVAAILCVASGTEVIKHKRGHSAVEDVVDMLKDMLDKSKDDGEAAKEAFEKFKEYCDENNKEKSKDIEDNTKDIKLLSAKIERLQGDNGELSVEVGRLHKEIAENEQQREEAESIRNKAHEAFLAEEEDLENAIDQMKDALETLSEVGADQTMGSAEDHEKMMAGFDASFLAKQTSTEKLAKRVQTALLAASSILTPAQKTKVDSFLQTKSPFTGSYSSQSGQVVGILKNMRDTFKSNLAEARDREEKEKDAFDELMDTLTDKYDKMKDAYDDKQDTLGSNDGSLADRKDALREAKQTVADAKDFLSKLLPLSRRR
jgi:DNA repair exonuclease SbcCD ATPase subunit